MQELRQFDIPLLSLQEDETPLEWEIDDRFFAALEATEVSKGQLHVSGSIRKASGFFRLSLRIQGSVSIPCNRCLDPMTQPVDTTLDAAVRLGDEDGETADGETIIVDKAEGIVNPAWRIYESVALTIPIQHVHQPGDCNDAMTKRLLEHSAARSSTEGEDSGSKPADPRWEALLKLKKS